VTRSRREIFLTHDDRARLARCPVCQRAIELDHEEALLMQPDRTAAPAPPKASAVPPPVDEPEATAVVGFALV
jgi:hypothetical protein